MRSLNKEGHSRILHKLGRVICLDMAGGRRQTSGAKAAAPSTSLTDDYFVFPDIVWIIVMSFGICLLFIATFSPDLALRLFPWPLGDFVNYMGHSHRHVCISLCVFMVVGHCVEAAYAGKVCQDKHLTAAATAKWSIMTFLFGFASLGRLLKYKRHKEDYKQH